MRQAPRPLPPELLLPPIMAGKLPAVQELPVPVPAKCLGEAAWPASSATLAVGLHVAVAPWEKMEALRAASPWGWPEAKWGWEERCLWALGDGLQGQAGKGSRASGGPP